MCASRSLSSHTDSSRSLSSHTDSVLCPWLADMDMGTLHDSARGGLVCVGGGRVPAVQKWIAQVVAALLRAPLDTKQDYLQPPVEVVETGFYKNRPFFAPIVTKRQLAKYEPRTHPDDKEVRGA